MKILIAPDKYKGTLTATEVCRCIEDGISVAIKNAGADSSVVSMISVPLADGGEGSMEALVGAIGTYRSVHTVDAHGRNIKTLFGVTSGDEFAVVEAARSIGLARLNRMERNPAMTSSYGFGRSILKAIEEGYRDFLLPIGGSATNDCGTGMLAAMGARFYDSKGGLIEFPSGGSMKTIASMELTALRRTIQGCRFTAICDISNPLLGENGAAYVYSPQKGADEKCVRMLEEGAVSFSSFASDALGRNLTNVPHTGAAGGLGWALAMFCNAKLVNGARYIAERVEFHRKLVDADLIITGEGRIDSQTPQGKVVGYVCQAARERGIPVVAYCGTKTKDVTPEFTERLGLARLILLTDHASFEQSINDPSRTLTETITATLPDLKLVLNN